jgi:hypothetical protein
MIHHLSGYSCTNQKRMDDDMPEEPDEQVEDFEVFLGEAMK